MRIGIDAGGTFTDFVALHDAQPGDAIDAHARLETLKIRSNPANPAEVILAGLARLAESAGDHTPTVIHGSTVATNALLEHKGARTAFVTTAGFEDLLEIGRQNRAELYNLTPAPRLVLAERALRFGIAERTLFDGSILHRPSADAVAKLGDRLKAANVQSVAICFLHAYQNPANERAVVRQLQSLLKGHAIYLCSSHDISPEFREYERASTTFVNAYVGPLMKAYLDRLSAGASQRKSRFPISIMQSNGGSLSAADASRHAVRTVLSGPAGGLVGATRIAALSGYRRIIGFDMGGTSTDVSLADGAPRETTDAIIDGLPIRVPMLDIHTVGAGGGSIARVDAGGLLRVGPESAGADPGPACYGKGELATVTDAHVVLGRLSSEQLLGGAMHIDQARATSAVEPIARSLNLDIVAAAAGILRVANANMQRAMRTVSVERGYDPRDFALVAFGGAGGLHACDIASELGIHTVIVPEHAGALSALGMILADEVRDYAAGVLGTTTPAALVKRFHQLERQARKQSPQANLAPEVKLEYSADLRYVGQSYELNVPWPRVAEASASGADALPTEAFHREHQRVYGYSDPQRAIEVVTIRVRARRATAQPQLLRKQAARSQRQQIPTRRIWINGDFRPVPVYARAQVPTRATAGPALIVDYGATTLIPPGWIFHVDSAGSLIAKDTDNKKQERRIAGNARFV
jgi:N-methylhydantoinase A/oxoprolinase/acetone carboxylase beta subunit